MHVKQKKWIIGRENKSEESKKALKNRCVRAVSGMESAGEGKDPGPPADSGGGRFPEFLIGYLKTEVNRESVVH